MDNSSITNGGTKIYLEKFLQDFARKSNVYNAIVEAISNGIDSIEARKSEGDKSKGLIVISIKRDLQQSLLQSERSAKITSIEISDNGIGFNDKNRDSFNTLYSQYKQDKGGKGLGRMLFAKNFRNVSVESTFKDEKGAYRTRSFVFGRKHAIIENEHLEDADGTIPTGAKITLSDFIGNLKEFNDSLEKFSHRVLEKILNYFASDNFECPEIRVCDENGTIILNDEIGQDNNSKISIMEEGETELAGKEKIYYKIFKLKNVNSQQSRIMLTAHNKVVTDVKLDEYIPEFKEDFVEQKDGQPQKYIIRFYVYGRYLDDNVNGERTDFYFDDNANLEFPIGKKDIELAIAKEARNVMKNEVTTRFQAKKKAFADYVEGNIWYKGYLDGVNFEKIKINPSKQDIEAELYRAKFVKDSEREKEVENILNSVDIKGEKLDERVEKIMKGVTETDRSNLARCVAFRKAVLDLFEKALQWNSNGKYELEDLLHGIIFPMKKTSKQVPYEKHNLWIIDERLNFVQLLSSDRSIFEESDDRPDLAVFHYPISYREGRDINHPVSIIEFKRPGRKDFIAEGSKQNPVSQVKRYVQQIKDGKVKNSEGVNITVKDNVTFYGYIIASADGDVKKWLTEIEGMRPTPDGEGWFSNVESLNLRIEFITWDKVLTDARIRHKLFFDQLRMSI